MTRQRSATTPVPFAASSPAPEARWFVSRGGKTAGPVTAQAITKKLADGSLSWSTLVWRDGMDGWIPARDAPEFAPSAPRPRVVEPVASSVFAVPDAPHVEVPQPGQATRLILVQAGLGRRRWMRAAAGAAGVTAAGLLALLALSRPQEPAPKTTPRVVVPVEVEPAPAPTPPAQDVGALATPKAPATPKRSGKHGKVTAPPPTERARVRLPDVEVESEPHSNAAESDAIRGTLGQGPARARVTLPGIDVSSSPEAGPSDKDVERVLVRARGGMERCVQRVAKNGTRVSRALSLQLSVRPDGKVGEARVRSGAGETDAALEECILNVAFGLRFPRAGGAGMDVEVPLRLRTR